MTFSSDWQLYVVLDPAAANGRDLADIAEAAIRGGADVLQLRDKSSDKWSVHETAQRILRISRKAQIPLIINDYMDIAKGVRAQGVHLGQEDGPVDLARKALGDKSIIGRSTHSLEQALQAQKEGADYIGFGPVFPTPTKPDYRSIGLGDIQAVHEQVTIPIVCIGGINDSSLPSVIDARARCVAVVRAVCSAENPESAARTLKDRLKQSSRGRERQAV